MCPCDEVSVFVSLGTESGSPITALLDWLRLLLLCLRPTLARLWPHKMRWKFGLLQTQLWPALSVCCHSLTNITARITAGGWYAWPMHMWYFFCCCKGDYDCIWIRSIWVHRAHLLINLHWKNMPEYHLIKTVTLQSICKGSSPKQEQQLWYFICFILLEDALTSYI